jgi:hypothetical protein
MQVESHALGHFGEGVRFALLATARASHGSAAQAIPGTEYGGPTEPASEINFGMDIQRAHHGAPLMTAPARARPLSSHVSPRADAYLTVGNPPAAEPGIVLIRLVDASVLHRLQVWVTD